MSGTRAGGRATSITNKTKYGDDFYSKIGAKGGKAGHTGGFASLSIGSDGLTGRERARLAGAIGGRISKRRKRDDTRDSMDRRV